MVHGAEWNLGTVARVLRGHGREQLGKDAADALLDKVDKMAKRGANAANIEKVFLADLGAHLEKRVSNFMVQDAHEDRAKTRNKREDFSQAAARIVRQATESK